jgi:hypothetical protein
MLEIIQSLWIGPRLSPMERLCIASFLRNGHPFHLYVYQNTDGIPPGTVVLDANQILPAARIFKYRGYDSYAGFSNFFRYKLLIEKGGWWVDTDTICLKPFTFTDSFVFSSEMVPSAEGVNDVPTVNNGIMRAPADSDVMRSAWAACERMNVKELAWGQCGPALMGRMIRQFSLQRHVRPPEVFCPLHCTEWALQLWGGVSWQFDETTFAVHLWNEMWRRGGANKSEQWNPDCLYEQLKRRYLSERASASS